MELVAVLAALHSVDHRAVGLETFGRTDSYAERQIRRWTCQWELVGPEQLKETGAELSRRLSARVPPQRALSIVHGDYRIDNTIVDLGGARVMAVVDWELSTIGDPVADVAMMCAYRNVAFNLIIGEEAAWTTSMVPDVEGLAAMYEAAGGVQLTDWTFHLALAYFKIAVIAAGIAHRSRAGATAEPGFLTADQAVEPFLASGLELL